MKRIAVFAGALTLVFVLAACGRGVTEHPAAETTTAPAVQPEAVKGTDDIAVEEREEEALRIKATANGQEFSIELYDNETARELAAMLPLTLDMSELNGNEKYYYLPERLPNDSQHVGSIRAGDLMLFGSDCLVLFYESFSTSYRYTPLGRVDDPEGLAAALGSGSVQVTFQKG